MRKFLWFLLLVPLFLKAQDIDSLSKDSVIVEPPPYYGAVFIQVEGRVGPTVGGLNPHTSLGAGLQYNKWSAGFHAFLFEGEVEALVVFPNVFELEYSYGGPFVGFELYDSDLWSADLYASYQLGDMVWERLETQEDFIRDKFSLVTLGLHVDLNNFRYAKPYFSAGYQIMNNLALERVDNSDFTGLYFAFGIRLGFYNQ